MASTVLLRVTCAALLIGALGGASAARADVNLAVTPESLTVAPGDTFTVQLSVPVSGSPFNGFGATVEFDPAALSFVPRGQAAQEGSLLHGYCGNSFYTFASAADSIKAADTMLCNGGFATGPGTLLILQFVAGPAGTTSIGLRRSVFYNDGLYVLPVINTGAFITIRSTTDVPGAPAPATRARLRAFPNPAHGTCLLRAEGVAPGGGEIVVFDALGRCVRRLRTPGGSATWDGGDDSGRTTPPGVYTAVLHFQAGVLRTTFVRLP